MFNWWRQEPPLAIVTQWECPELDKAIMKFCGEKTRVIGTFRLPSRIPDGWSSVVADRGDAVDPSDLPDGFQRVSDSTFEYVGKEDPFEKLFKYKKFAWRDMGSEISYLYKRRRFLGRDDQEV